MRFKEYAEEGLEKFSLFCENSPTPLVVIPLVYRGIKLLKAKFDSR